MNPSRPNFEVGIYVDTLNGNIAFDYDGNNNGKGFAY